MPQTVGQDLPSFLGDSNRKETIYLLLPSPDIYREMGFGSTVARIRPGGEQIKVEVSVENGFSIFYVFDTSLNFISARPADAARSVHDALFLDARIDHRLSEAEVASWSKVVRFRTAPIGNSSEVDALF